MKHMLNIHFFIKITTKNINRNILGSMNHSNFRFFIILQINNYRKNSPKAISISIFLSSMMTVISYLIYLLVIMILNNYYLNKMSTLDLKRKSYAKVQPQPQLPTLNTPLESQPDKIHRTQYAQLTSPIKQLQSYRRREISISNLVNPQSSEKKKSSFHLNITKKSETNTKHFKSNPIAQDSIMKLSPTDTTDYSGNHKTDYSHARINTVSIEHMGQSRFQDDHHNTNSLAELINNNSIHPVGLQTERNKIRLQVPQIKNLSYGTLEDEEEQDKKISKSSLNQYQDDGYLPGQQAIDYKEEQKAKEIKGKSYKDQSILKILARQMPDNYKPITQPQFRMQQAYWLSQRKRLMTINQDKEMISMMQQYQRIKSQMKMKMRKKYELKNMISSLKNHIPGTVKINDQKPQKSLSLPSLKHKIPIDKLTNQKDNNDIKILKTNEGNPEFIENRLKNSLSVARLAQKKQKKNIIIEQLADYQRQMPKYGEIAFIPPNKDLFSNAHYKKFPLGF